MSANYQGLREANRKLELANQELRRAHVEAIGSFACSVAHDFNNLLTVILSCAEFALGRLEGTSQLREDIEEVKKAGERAAALTKQLLAFSGRQVLEPKILSLNHIVLDMEKMLRRLIGEDIDLSIRLDSALRNVMVDRGQLEQVIMNLAVNARDAMIHGGRMTIETANVELRSGLQVMLAISDTGVGMDPVTRERIFEPFFTTKVRGKGAGLGLSTSYGIVAQSGGDIGVYSELGKGSSFKIYLPSS